MNDNVMNFLALPVKPARCTSEMAGWILGFSEHDIPILVAAKQLKPLGKPEKNGVKYFSTAELIELSKNRDWLNKATEIVRIHWQRKNDRKKCNPPQDTVVQAA